MNVDSKKNNSKNNSNNFFFCLLESWQRKMNTGGSYNLGINYDQLEFPGPEVASMAIAATARIRQRKQQQKQQPGNQLLSESNNNNDDDENNDNALFVALLPTRSPSLPRLELATFAGGCFWGLELALQRIPGVEHTLVGYTQGDDLSEARPNYEQVSAGNTGHCEAVMVYFDPSVVAYADLAAIFLDRCIDDPTNRNGGMGRDVGDHYRTGMYVHTAEQRDAALRAIRAELSSNPRYTNNNNNNISINNNNNNRTNRIKSQRTVMLEVKPARAFWPAEAYHQRYLEKGGRFGRPQSAAKGNTDEIRCYG